jgi:hypothetical protein
MTLHNKFYSKLSMQIVTTFNKTFKCSVQISLRILILNLDVCLMNAAQRFNLWRKIYGTPQDFIDLKECGYDCEFNSCSGMNVFSIIWQILLSSAVGSMLFYYFIYSLVHGNLCNVASILSRSPNGFQCQLDVT